MLADMLSNNLTMLGVGVCENILDEIIAVLVTCDVDKRNSRTIVATLADSIEVAAEEVNTTNLEALFNDFGSKLIHAVLGSITNNMINSSTAISWSTVLADVLNAPVTKLTMSDNVNAGENLFNTRALR